MKPRQRARMLALQALFEIDSVNHPAEEVVRRRLQAHPLPTPAAQLMQDLVYGVLKHRSVVRTLGLDSARRANKKRATAKKRSQAV